MADAKYQHVICGMSEKFWTMRPISEEEYFEMVEKINLSLDSAMKITPDKGTEVL